MVFLLILLECGLEFPRPVPERREPEPSEARRSTQEEVGQVWVCGCQMVTTAAAIGHTGIDGISAAAVAAW